MAIKITFKLRHGSPKAADPWPNRASAAFSSKPEDLSIADSAGADVAGAEDGGGSEPLAVRARGSTGSIPFWLCKYYDKQQKLSEARSRLKRGQTGQSAKSAKRNIDKV
eukprot:scaffold108827_cov46-Prasinocladus_malaysianus.AAC.2